MTARGLTMVLTRREYRSLERVKEGEGGAERKMQGFD